MSRLHRVTAVALAVAAATAVVTTGASQAAQAAPGTPAAAGGAPGFAARVSPSTTQVVRTLRSDRWCRRVWCTRTQAWEKVHGVWRVASMPDGRRADFRSSIGPSGFRPAHLRREGDGSTPAGTFRIVVTFSTSDAAPGAMPWRRRLPTSVVSATHGRFYNTWIEQPARRDGDRPSMRWGFWVGFNKPRLVPGVGPRPVPGRGSGIFYHTSRPGHRWSPTEGCTNLGNPSEMRWVVGWLRPGAHPRVVQHR